MKMKSKIARYRLISNYILSTDKFKIIFLLMVALVLYGGVVLGTNINNFFDSILMSYQFFFFNIFFFALLIFNTLNTCSVFDKLKFYIIRLKDKKHYLREMVLISLIQNLIFIILFLILYFSVLILLKFGMFDVYSYKSYEISNLIYSLFYLVRYIFISLLISIIISILNFKYNNIVNRIVIILFLIGFFVFSELGINNLFIFKLLPYNYLNDAVYDRFLSEVIYSSIYLVTLVLIILVLFKSSRRKTYIHKYLLFNDISYLFRNRLKFLVILLIVPALILLILNRNFKVGFSDILLSTFGNNIIFNNSVIEYVMFLFNIISFVFIALDLYIKDIKNEIDYIFLRMDSYTWYKNKFLFLIIITFIIKILQYLLVLFSVIIIDNKVISKEIFYILLLDVFNILIYQLIVVICYFSLTIGKKTKWLIFMIAIVVMFLIPKNLVSLNKNLFLFIGILIIMYIILGCIIKKNKRKILLLGGV